MDDIRQRLNSAFVGFSYEVADGKRIIVRYHWNIVIEGVASVRIMLCGKDPLTGQQLEAEEIARLSPTKTQDSRIFPYDGCFSLRFDALDRYGNVLVEDFRKREAVRLVNQDKRAVVKYAVQPYKHGWSKLAIDTNCPIRCKNKLWAYYNGRYQLVPPLKSGENNLYLPAVSISVQLVFDETGSEDQKPIDCIAKG